MKCTLHTDRDAAGMCTYSGKPYCSECLVDLEGRFYFKENIKFVMQKIQEKAAQKDPMVFMNAGGGGASAASAASSSGSDGKRSRTVNWGMFVILLILTGGLGLLCTPLWYS